MSEKSTEIRRNFTTIRKHFLRHLSANDNVNVLSQRFSALNSNCERVDFVLELFGKSKIKVDFNKESKSDEDAAKWREQGNEMFKVRKLKAAWECYTKSICYAEDGGVNLGLAYANRSAVLFELDLHKQCLMDIGRALENNYPDHLKSKLFVREKNCKNLEVEVFRESHEGIPTVNEPNPKIECADSCLEIFEENGWGRFVVATRDIKAGEVLAVENPFALLLVNQYFSHCHECIKLCYNLIPCRSCIHTMYCSESCRQRAFDGYHKYECSIISTLKYLELDKLKLLPLKIAFLIKDQYTEIDNLIKQPAEMYQSNRYKEIHNLISNTSKRNVPDLFERATAAAIIFNLVKENTQFFENTNEDYERIFKEILLLHMQTGPSNFHEITELAPNSIGNYEPEEIASGAYAFLSLLNHSCSPNVTRFCYGSTIVLRAIQNIKKGEQCFDNYGYHYALMNRTERKKQLDKQYYFDCICPACENDWSTYNELVVVNNRPEIDEDLFLKLSLADVETAQTVLQESLIKLGELQKTQPSTNFCRVQEVVKQCYAAFGNKRRIF